MTSKEKKSLAFISVSIACFYYLLSYIARAEPGVLVNELMTEFKLNSSNVGFIISIMYIPYVIMQIPCGILVDKFGARIVLTCCAFLCALGTFVFGHASSTLELEVGRFLIGFASASAFLSCGKIASDSFDKSKYSIIMGIAMLMGCVGGASAGAPAAYCVSQFGWRPVTFVIAAALVLIAVLSFIFVGKNKSENAEGAVEKGKILEGIKMIALNSGAWVIGLYGAISYLPLSALAELWGTPFVQIRFGVSTETAGITSVLTFMGFGLGSILAAYEARLLKSYKKTIIMNALLLVFAMYTALYSNSISFSLCNIMFFFAGLFAGTNTLCFTLAYELIPEKYAGTSAGFMNAVIMSSGLLFQPMLGKLLDFFRNGEVSSAGEPLYTLSMYREAFYVVIISMILAGVLTFFIKEKKINVL